MSVRMFIIIAVAIMASQIAFSQGCLKTSASGPVFQTSLMDAQAGQFTYEADVTPLAAGSSISAGVGLAAKGVNTFSDMAATVRFYDGYVDMRNGPAYGAESNIPFTPGATYHVRMVVNVPAHTYTGYMRPLNSDTETVIGQNYSFRDTQQSVAKLGLWTLFSDVGSASACDAAAYPSYEPIRQIWFDGVKGFVEVPSRSAFSVPSTGALTVAVSIRPDTLAFSKVEGTGYVDFLGKGQGYGSGGQQEWYFRIYSSGNSENRGNRISFYVFNPQGGQGNGSYFQDSITPGAWINLVAVVDRHSTYLYRDGVLRDCDNYNNSGPSTCDPPYALITPVAGNAPLRIGTVDLSSFFRGSMKNVRMWNRALSASEISALNSGTVPQNGLVAQYLFSGDVVSGGPAPAGTVYGAHWRP